MSAFDAELSSSIQDVEKQLNALANFSNPADVRERLVKIESKVKGLTSTLHHLQTEIRSSDDKSTAVKLTKAAADHDKKIKDIKGRIKDVKDRLQGGGAAGSPTAAAGGPRGDGKDAARAKAQNIDAIQNAALDSLKRTQQTVQETKDIGDEAVGTLKKQTDQIIGINRDLDKLETEVQRGKTELNAFIRRMATDKILLCFLFLIVAGIITVIVLKVKNPLEELQARTDAPSTTVPGKSETTKAANVEAVPALAVRMHALKPL